VPGSEHVSPVSCAASYPPSVAAAAASMAPADAVEETASDIPPEPAVSTPEMDAEKELLPTDGDDAADQPVSDEQGKLLH